MTDMDREEAKNIWAHMANCLTKDDDTTKAMPWCCVKLITEYGSRARASAIEEALKEVHMIRMEKFVAASRETDTHEQAFLETECKLAEKIEVILRTLSQQEDGK